MQAGAGSGSLARVPIDTAISSSSPPPDAWTTPPHDRPPRLFVDADACPVKPEIVRVALRLGAPVLMVAAGYTRLAAHPLLRAVAAGPGFDAADDWIAARVAAEDIVITGDIPLADRALKNGARVLNHTGRPFTPDSIGMALATRALMADLRAMGEAGGGPKPFAAADRSRFLSALDTEIQKARRALAGSLR